MPIDVREALGPKPGRPSIFSTLSLREVSVTQERDGNFKLNRDVFRQESGIRVVTGVTIEARNGSQIEPKVALLSDGDQVPQGQFGLIPLERKSFALTLGKFEGENGATLKVDYADGRYTVHSGENFAPLSTDKPLLVGRIPQSMLKDSDQGRTSLVVEDPSKEHNISSRTHATVSQVNVNGKDYLLVEDLSANGTWVNMIRSKGVLDPSILKRLGLDNLPRTPDGLVDKMALDGDSFLDFSFKPMKSGDFSDLFGSKSFISGFDIHLSLPSLSDIELGPQRFEVGVASQASRKHPHSNEDFTYPSPENPVSANGIVMLCDGMGGHAAGDKASRTAVATMRKKTDGIKADATPEDIERSFREALETANTTLKLEVPGAGTTAILAKKVTQADGSQLFVYGSSGDSRITVLRDGKLIPVTQDHNLLRADFENGEITEAEYKRILNLLDTVEDPTKLDSAAAYYFANRNIVAGGLGISRATSIDTGVFALEPGDRVIITSDGIHDTLTTNQIIATMAKSSSAQTQADLLVQEVAKITSDDRNVWHQVGDHVRGKVDDMSAIVFAA